MHLSRIKSVRLEDSGSCCCSCCFCPSTLLALLQCGDLTLDIDAAAADTVEAVTALGRQPGVDSVRKACVCVCGELYNQLRQI